MTFGGSWKDERRAHQRVAATHPICFEWQTVEGDILRVRGTTCNISAGGALAYVSHPLAVGLWVRFDVEFPTELTGGHPKKLRCRGLVTRKMDFANQSGIAISTKTRQMIEDTRLHRRSYFRAIPLSLATVDYLNRHAIVRDLNRTGAYIETSDPLPIGKELELLLQIHSLRADVPVLAVVRRTEPSVGMGVEFIVLKAAADSLLQELSQRGSHAA